MAENQGDKPDKIDPFTREGETLGYISMDQARVLAIQHASQNTDFYGPRFSGRALAWQMVTQEETEDYYDIRLSYRPAGRFRGEPGLEQFTISKVDDVVLRQILDEPVPSKLSFLRFTAVGLVIVVVVAAVAVGAAWASGAFKSGGEEGGGGTVSEATRIPRPTTSELSDSVPTATPVRPEPTVPPIQTATAVPAEPPTATPVSFGGQPLLQVALARPDHESMLPWERDSNTLGALRPRFEYLLEVDRFGGELLPMLAEQWEIAEGGLSWQFRLREGVQFHFGWGKLSAPDVAFSLELLAFHDGPGAQSSQFWRDVVEDIEIVDDYTLTLHLNRPEPDLLRMVSSESDLMILSEAQWVSQGPDGIQQEPAGTGPYQFSDRAPFEFISFQRVEDHWRVFPDFEELEIIFVSDVATRAAVLRTTQVQIAEIPRFLVDDIAAPQLDFVESQVPAFQVAFFMGGQYYATPEALDRDFPWLDRRVRQAINFAINRDEINDIVFPGRAETAEVAGFHPSLAGWNPDWQTYPYNPGFAKQLLAEAGYPDGFGFKMAFASAPDFPEMAQIAEIIAFMLEDIGLVPELQELERASLIDAARNKALQGVLWGGRIGYRQPQDSIRILNHSGPDGVLYTFEESVIDDIYERLIQETDENVREELLQAIGNLKYNNFVEVPLFWIRTLVGVDRDVVGQYIFPGHLSGGITHLEYVEATR